MPRTPKRPSRPLAQLAALQPRSRDRKLVPVEFIDRGHGRPEPVATGPHAASTYLPIDATCPATCAFFAGGCYARAGAARSLVNALDLAAAGVSAREVIDAEVALIDGAFRGGRVPRDGGRDGRRGRDLRLHVSGDVGDARDARALASAASRWSSRGGGVVWTYTHRWRSIPRSAWGPIRVLASIEETGSAAVAKARGYDVALVVPEFVRSSGYLDGRVRIIPCPAQTRNATCVQCRLCIDVPHASDAVIGFAAHGPAATSARRRLKVLNDEQEAA